MNLLTLVYRAVQQRLSTSVRTVLKSSEPFWPAKENRTREGQELTNAIAAPVAWFYSGLVTWHGANQDDFHSYFLTREG